MLVQGLVERRQGNAVQQGKSRHTVSPAHTYLRQRSHAQPSETKVQHEKVRDGTPDPLGIVFDFERVQHKISGYSHPSRHRPMRKAQAKTFHSNSQWHTWWNTNGAPESLGCSKGDNVVVGAVVFVDEKRFDEP